MNHPSQPPIAILSRHVKQQFERRQLLAPARFILDEVAQRMVSRLQYIKVQPEHILDAGCGLGHGIEALQALYPEAQYLGVDHQASFVAAAQRRFAQSPRSVSAWLMRLKQLKQRQSVPEFVVADMAQTGLAPNSVDLLWSNMALHWHPTPTQVFEEWHRLLNVDGLLMFSCFGPLTLQELRQALQESQWHGQRMSFIDMHDLGDMLVQCGFKDPVMDQEVITLSYKTPQKLLADVRALGGNPNPQRQAALVGRARLERLYEALERQRAADGLIRLSLEIVYGHAWRGASFTLGGETRIAVTSLGRS